MRDRRLLYATTFLRALATGMVGVLLGLYLVRLRFTASQSGFVVGIGLAGAALAALAVTLAGARLGRRTTLVGVGVLSAVGGLALAWASDPAVVALVAFAGMVNGMGRDRGAALVVEQAMLPSTTTDAQRTGAFAWYNVLQDAGHALGGLLAGLPALLERTLEIDALGSMRAAFALYAVLHAVGAGCAAVLSPAVEPAAGGPPVRLSVQSRAVLWRLSALFALDATAGGFLTAALLAVFFFERFGAAPELIGVLFFGARVANALSHLGAAWLARRIGLVNTMVFTHIPSSLLLVTVPFAPNFTVAAILFLLREGLVEMDVPTRQSYVMAVVRPEERTVASGVTSLVRMGGWAVAPPLAGALMQGASLAVPLIVGAAMKIAYDVLLYAAFRGTKPPEETAG
jgi:MFS family permease